MPQTLFRVFLWWSGYRSSGRRGLWLIHGPSKPLKTDSIMWCGWCQPKSRMQRCLGMVGKRPEELFHQFRLEAAQLHGGGWIQQSQVRAAAEIDGYEDRASSIG